MNMTIGSVGCRSQPSCCGRLHPSRREDQEMLALRRFRAEGLGMESYYVVSVGGSGTFNLRWKGFCDPSPPNPCEAYAKLERHTCVVKDQSLNQIRDCVT